MTWAETCKGHRWSLKLSNFHIGAVVYTEQDGRWRAQVFHQHLPGYWAEPEPAKARALVVFKQLLTEWMDGLRVLEGITTNGKGS
jgi:hypothetical protein